jgi:tetratricopeptide (TPR) repeat protein
MAQEQADLGYQERMGLARAAYDELKLADALDYYRAAAKLEPRSYDAWLGQARTLARMRQPEQSRLTAERCVELDPQRAEAYVTLGVLHFLTDRLDDAADVLLKAIELAPQDPEAYLTLAQVYSDQKKMEEAWGMHSQASGLIAAMPDELQRAQMEALSLHVTTYLQLAEGKDAEAIETAQQVIAYEEVSPYAACLAYSNLGILQARARRYDEAIEYLEHAFEMNPHFYRAGGALGRILIVRNKNARAAEVLGRVVELNPETEGGTHYAYGLSLARTGRREEALQQFRQALAKGVSNPDALMARWQTIWLSTVGRYVVIGLIGLVVLLWVVLAKPSPQIITFVGLLAVILILQRTLGRRKR